MTIIFHENQLSYRGTTNALFDYAFFNERLLGNTSVIVYDKNNSNNYQPAIDRFKENFKVIGYESTAELEGIVTSENASIFYAIKSGKKDGVIVTNCKMVVHVVFKHFEPHGDVYAYVSQWLAKEMTGGKSNYVPHMISVEETEEDLRQELNIPKEAIVFGRHGGADTFDLTFVKKAIYALAKQRKDLYFIFMGTNTFVIKHLLNPFKNVFKPLKNIIFLPAASDRKSIAKFINTCDAYLHARKQGESFGIAIGEFSVKNKPIITWGKSKEKSHLAILGNKALVYNNTKELKCILENFKPDTSKNWDAYSEKYSPIAVMQKFKQVFITRGST